MPEVKASTEACMAVTAKLKKKQHVRPQAGIASRSQTSNSQIMQHIKQKLLPKVCMLLCRQQKKLHQKKQKLRNKYITLVGATQKQKLDQQQKHKQNPETESGSRSRQQRTPMLNVVRQVGRSMDSHSLYFVNRCSSCAMSLAMSLTIAR